MFLARLILKSSILVTLKFKLSISFSCLRHFEIIFKALSADYCSEKRLLYVFSSDPATEIESAGKAYNHVNIFRQLECNNDIKICAKKLKTLGF